MNNIYESLKRNADISQDDIVSLLELEDFSKVFELADKINFDNFKNKVDIRAILEFSNYCKRKCAYCGLNSNNKNITRYRIAEKEILQVDSLAIRRRSIFYSRKNRRYSKKDKRND